MAVDANMLYAMAVETVYQERRAGGRTESRIGQPVGRVFRAPKSGGGAVTLVSQPSSIDTLRLGAHHFVWHGYQLHAVPK